MRTGFKFQNGQSFETKNSKMNEVYVSRASKKIKKFNLKDVKDILNLFLNTGKKKGKPLKGKLVITGTSKLGYTSIVAGGINSIDVENNDLIDYLQGKIQEPNEINDFDDLYFTFTSLK